MLDFKGKRVVVIGLGISGIAACRMLASRGATVVGTDARTNIEPIPGVELALGGHAAAKLSEADLIVVSPGVPMFPELAAAEKAGVKIWGEVELAVQALPEPKPPIIAIGGTNGKSTTTSLIGELLEAAGKNVFIGGNLGEPLAAHADSKFDVVVLEVSSFQMERVEAFKPRVSVLLNITPDHLDRYPSEQAYADAKGNSFVRQSADDFAVVPANDPVCLAQAKRGKAKIVTFGPGGDFSVTNDAITDAFAVYPRAAIALQGGHNALNVAAALAAIKPFRIQRDIIETVLGDFKGLAHRMVFVRALDEVRYYDDSKGTNVGASVTAIRGVSEDKVVLIAGGKDKGGSYEPLADAMRERGRAAVLIGEAAPLIARALEAVVPIETAKTMDDAVAAARRLANRGDAVLLSPACSSFDMFKDYKDRGDAFVRAVMELPA
jgi:UDP-N-acetylmuramoylalanine--D-glutamate ligase